MSEKHNTYFQHILRTFRRRRALDRLRHTGLLFLIVNAAYVLVCLLLESVWYLSPGVKEALAWILVLNAGFLVRALLLVFQGYSRHPEKANARLLLHIGRQYPEVRDRLLNHYQLSQEDDALRDYAVSRFIEAHPPEKFNDACRPEPAGKKLKISLGLLLLLLISGVLLRDPAARLLHIHASYEPPLTQYLSVTPEDSTLYAYDSLRISVRRHAPPAFPVELYRLENGKAQRLEFTRERDSLCSYDLYPVRRSAVYVAALRRPHVFYPRKYPDRDTVRVTVLRRPKVKTLDIRVSAPAYTQIPEVRYQGNIDRIRCIRGSRIDIRAELSETAGPSFFIFSGDTLDVLCREDTCKSTFIPEQSGTLGLFLRNAAGIRIREPLRYRVELEEDAYPGIDVIRPEQGEAMILTEAPDLPLMVRIRDDYGFSSLNVRYSVRSAYGREADTAENTCGIPVGKDPGTRTVVDTWEIKEFISPGSEIVYRFELADNDTVSGPKTVSSRDYYARFPTLGDLYEKQDRKQRSSMEALEEESAESAELAEEIETIRRELLQEGELDWEKKTALEESADRLEKSREKLKDIRESMEAQKRFMEENALFSEKVMEDFGQLQELMNELIDDELFELMREMRKKFENDDRSGMEELMEDFSEKAKAFEKSLDRMLQVFKRVQQEQRLEELAERMKENLRQQEQLLESTREQSAEDLSEQQEKIGREAEDWEKLGEESSALFDAEDKEQFDEFLRRADSAAVSSDMRRAAEAYREQQRSRGMQKSREAGDELRDLSQSFSDMASSMMQGRREAVSASFRSAFQKALYMSVRQEALNRFSEDIDRNSPLLHEFTSRQGKILESALDINAHLMALSMKTFFVDKALGRELGRVIGNLKSGIQHVEEADIPRGKNEINKAFSAMNRLARMLMERMEDAQQEQGGGSGMESYLQQLQQMAGQQQQLNRSMPQPGAGGDSMMDRLAELAARQQALRRSLKEIRQGISERGGEKRVTGDLDRIAKDMENVINEMRKHQVRRETVMRQEKIVQRLLDASRSATTRDHKKERQSETAKQIERESPPGLPADFGERESLINALRRAVRESALSPQNKRDMEAYLESLLGKERELNMRRTGE